MTYAIHIYNKSDKGFTLIETLVAVALISLLSIMIVNIFISYNDFFLSHESNIDTARSANAIMSEVGSAVLQATQVSTTHTFAGTSYSSDADTLVLELPAITQDGDTVPSAFDYVALYASGTVAYLVVDAHASSVRSDETRTLSTTLYSLTFGYDSASMADVSSVETDVRTRAERKGRTVESHLKQQVYLRNK